MGDYRQRVHSIDLGRQANGRQYETLQLGDLPTGIYVVQIMTDGVSAGTLRLVKS